MKKKYPVILTEAKREELKRLIAAATSAARKLVHARIVLKAHQSPEGPGWVDEVQSNLSGTPALPFRWSREKSSGMTTNVSGAGW